MVGQQQAGLARIADQFEERAQALRIVEVRHAAGERRQPAVAIGLGEALRQHRAAEALLAGAQADQPQLANRSSRTSSGVSCVRTSTHRRERA